MITSVGIYIGIRYIKGNGFKENKSLGQVLVLLGIVYFLYTLITYIFSNLTDNPGGELRPILAFVWMVLTVPLGLVIKNGTK